LPETFIYAALSLKNGLFFSDNILPLTLLKFNAIFLQIPLSWYCETGKDKT